MSRFIGNIDEGQLRELGERFMKEVKEEEIYAAKKQEEKRNLWEKILNYFFLKKIKIDLLFFVIISFYFTKIEVFTRSGSKWTYTNINVMNVFIRRLLIESIVLR